MPDETPATDASNESEQTVDYKAEAERWKGHAREWERRAKENKDAADQVAALKSQLDEQAATLTSKYNEQLVTTELRHGASRRAIDADALLEGVRTDKFIKDGAVDKDAIENWLNRVAPPVDVLKPSADFGDGNRNQKPSFALNDDDGLLDAFIKAGIQPKNSER